MAAISAPPLVLTQVYTRPVAKVMISIPDELLAQLDAEVGRRGTSRSGLLQAAVRRELGLLGRSREAVLADLDQLSRAWAGPVDAAALIRADRRRDG
jgi:hypothetical protein